MKGKSNELDVIVLGAGPAGLSAAMWCAELGLSAMVIEQGTEAGGQLHHIHNPITNYLGLKAQNGADLNRAFLDTFERFNVPIEFGSTVDEVNVESVEVATVDGARRSAGFLIVASGVSRRKLCVPGEDEFAGKGILVSGARDRKLTKGKEVVVIGGGDAAFENAIMISEFATRVYIIHRRHEFRARSEFVARASADPKIELILESQVASIGGRDSVEEVTVRDRTGRSTDLRADFVLIRIGVVPNSTLLTGKAVVDSEGYVLVDAVGRTSAERIYAVGDVACPISPTVATAAGMGAAAAKDIRARLDSKSVV